MLSLSFPAQVGKWMVMRSAGLGRMAALPETVRHLVLVLTVPIVFAKLPLSEQTLAAIDSLPAVRNALAKTGLGSALVDKCALAAPMSGSGEKMRPLYQGNSLQQRMQGSSCGRHLYHICTCLALPHLIHASPPCPCSLVLQQRSLFKPAI